MLPTYLSPGSLADPSIFSRAGLFRTMEHIPYNDGLLGQEPGFAQMWINAYCRSFVIPLWMIALVAAVMPARWMVNWRRVRIRQSRIEQGRCGECGYDLRATLEKCPECGSVKEAASTGT